MHDDTPPTLAVGLPLHCAGLALLLVLSMIAWRGLGEPYPVAFWTAVGVPVVHQLFVWLTWRLELKNRATSRTIGFGGYLAGFFLLFLGRFVALIALAALDRGSLGLPPLLRGVATVALAAPGLYAMYSVARYFGLSRAAGADHFDPRYRDLPLVKQGIFRYTDNGMYLYAFMLFWAIAVGFDSSAAIVVAAFSHAYIWVHFYATEKPDMEYLYGSE